MRPVVARMRDTVARAAARASTRKQEHRNA
ncbi:hypothetical protein GGR69_002648 [Xanthomonas arboricola]|nr:hypothetical protein [Xanthomonas arboricola]MBB5860938.1 hypothetical protein [Xanthomonas arboricola]